MTQPLYTVLSLEGDEHRCKCGLRADRHYIVPVFNLDHKFCIICRETLKVLLPLEFSTGNFPRDVELTKALDEPPTNPIVQ
jgi:hypothetical protein